MKCGRKLLPDRLKTRMQIRRPAGCKRSHTKSKTQLEGTNISQLFESLREIPYQKEKTDRHEEHETLFDHQPRFIHMKILRHEHRKTEQKPLLHISATNNYLPSRQNRPDCRSVQNVSFWSKRFFERRLEFELGPEADQTNWVTLSIAF